MSSRKPFYHLPASVVNTPAALYFVISLLRWGRSILVKSGTAIILEFRLAIHARDNTITKTVLLLLSTEKGSKTGDKHAKLIGHLHKCLGIYNFSKKYIYNFSKKYIFCYHFL